jgi:Zn-dependent peptidase ImmA (M78 family)
MTASATVDSATDYGARLASRRRELGADLAMAAGWSSLSQARIREIEEGAPIRSWELETLCRALAVDPGAFFQRRETSPRRSVARFRAAGHGVEPAAGDLRLLAIAAEIGRIGGFLAETLGRSIDLRRLRSIEAVSAKEKPWRQGYRLGEQARNRAGLPLGPIADLERELNRWGVHVARVRFSSEDVDAASLWEGKALPILLLNTASPRTARPLPRRAVLAHELCHLLHDAGEAELTTQLSWSEGTGNAREAVEQRARAFAPAFLAPRDWVRHELDREMKGSKTSPEAKVRQVASHWGLSYIGAVWHAKNCRLINAQTAERLLAEADRPEGDPWDGDFESGRGAGPALGVRERLEPDQTLSPLVDGLAGQLVLDALDAGAISKGRAREILSWS